MESDDSLLLDILGGRPSNSSGDPGRSTGASSSGERRRRPRERAESPSAVAQAAIENNSESGAKDDEQEFLDSILGRPREQRQRHYQQRSWELLEHARDCKRVKQEKSYR